LRVEHIKLKEDNKVEFDFLGKDSMRYNNTVVVLPEIWQNLQEFVKSKKGEEDLFDKIDAS
jgi:DNA topoisomerase-1